MTEPASIEGREINLYGVLRSSDIARLAGTTPRALRHYHKIGLLAEVRRDANGYRCYGAAELIRVLRIRQLAAGGMPLRQIALFLDGSAENQAEAIAALDEALLEESERIRQQRQIVAELLNSHADPGRFGAGGCETKTQQLDRDIWTLVTAGSAQSQGFSDALSAKLREDSVAALAAQWYQEFESLEQQDTIDPDRAESLADRMVSFAQVLSEFTETLPERSGVSGKAAGDTDYAAGDPAVLSSGAGHAAGDPATPLSGAESHPFAALIEHTLATSLSGAQQLVWRLFQDRISQHSNQHNGGS